MRHDIPDDLFSGPTVEIPTGLAADALHTLAVDADFLRRLALLIRIRAESCGRFELDRLAARVVAGDIDATAARLERTFTALNFGRVLPGDDDATEH